MNAKQFTLFSPLILLTSCAGPTAEQSVSAWVGGGWGQAKVPTNDPCDFLKPRFKPGQTLALDKRDCLMVRQTIRHALEYAPDGQASIWKNPASGNGGTIFIVSTANQEGYMPAVRTYKMVMQTSKGSQTVEGIGRRQADGTWALVE